MDWLRDRWHDVTNLGSGGWLAIAVWVAVVLGVVALIYAVRQNKNSRDLELAQIRPQVAMYMEPHAADWHIIEVVVRNFGETAAHNIQFNWVNPPTVAQYENAQGGMVDIGELRLPRELPQLAPGQEWRSVWDSALDRYELGGSIEWRFDGTLTYYDRPESKSRWRKGRRQQFETKVVLDWDELQPVPRVELMTSHDLAGREKQKLELLRSLMNYFHYATQETRPDVYRSEIDRFNQAAREARDRLQERQIDAAPTEALPALSPNSQPAVPPESSEEGRHHESVRSAPGPATGPAPGPA